MVVFEAFMVAIVALQLRTKLKIFRSFLISLKIVWNFVPTFYMYRCWKIPVIIRQARQVLWSITGSDNRRP